MKKENVCFLVAIFFTTISCKTSESNLIGIYIKNPSENTIDTLFLYENHKYKQVIYYKTGELFGVNENNWRLNGDKIDFMNLYLNYDLDLSNYTKPENGIIGETLLMTSLLPFSNGKIIIDKDRKVFYFKKSKL
ncbi:hypothetical protein AB4865_06780 [Capnocytophaga sp. ARDL2]|uniref:hypothetical protein n=1 Tax=Capnocytophaga sp. ARDL2 TaxID=3238809 RepID=UPI003557ABC5